MRRDLERTERLGHELNRSRMEALVVAQPSSVLLLTGYRPVKGASLAVATQESKIALVAPADEEELASCSWADHFFPYDPMSIQTLTPLFEVIRPVFGRALESVGATSGSIGYEQGPTAEPSSYAGGIRFGESLVELIRGEAPEAHPKPADQLLMESKSILTSRELDLVRQACDASAGAFEAALSSVHAGTSERIAASLLNTAFAAAGAPDDAFPQAYYYVMSGPNAALANRAYQHSTDRKIALNETVLVHCNSSFHGFWTDITRTYVLGTPSEAIRKAYDAIFAARDAALAVIRPGVSASAVDLAARRVMQAHGLGANFPHPLGHGVGFTAVDHSALPCIHPHSTDILDHGMVFNVEPAAYFDSIGGVRHCDMVVVTRTGVEVLTPFQSRVDDLLRKK